MADATMLDNQVDTSWVTPMGRRAKMLMENYQSEDPEVKADAAEQIMAVGEVLEETRKQSGLEDMPLTESQRAILDLYKQIKGEQVN